MKNIKTLMLKFLSLKMKKFPPCCFILSFILFFFCIGDAHKTNASEKQVTRVYVLKAGFIHNFTKFIQWPWESGSSNNSNEFSLCVLGENPFGAILDHLAKKERVKGRLLSIKTYVHFQQIRDCQVLFVSQSEDSNIERIVEQIKDFPVLTMGDTEGYASRGIGINLIIIDDKIRFEINREAIEKGGLNISSELLELAIIVPGRTSP